MNVPPELHCWIYNFLVDRPQCVTVSGATSDVTILSTGTPQCCVLSSVLYTVYTNDGASQCSGVVKIKYADDLACCGLIQGGDEGDYRREISSLENWSNEQKLFINKEQNQRAHH